MFTGIVKSQGIVHSVTDLPGLRRLTLSAPSSTCLGLEPGASVAVNGACLTATAITATTITFDLIQETLLRTNLGLLKVNDATHLERSLKVGDEIGGHLLSGHIDTTATILSIQTPANNYILTLSLPANYSSYTFPKGYIAIDGVSLTIVSVDRLASTFTVHLIPETLRATHLSALKPGGLVNIEIDRNTQVTVDTVNRILAEKQNNEKIS
jgi:riboflavin synthase